MTEFISQTLRAKWQVPAYENQMWLGKKHNYCVVIPVINEGNRIHNLLARMAAINVSTYADIIIIDGGSTDGSLNPNILQEKGVRGLILKKAPGKLSAQLRCAYAFALEQGYEGIVTIDGNDKDDPVAIPQFITALKDGVHFVQASRFLVGGVAENTPLTRDIAIRFIHAPMISFFQDLNGQILLKDLGVIVVKCCLTSVLHRSVIFSHLMNYWHIFHTESHNLVIVA